LCQYQTCVGYQQTWAARAALGTLSMLQLGAVG